MNRSAICVCLEPPDDFWGLGHLTTDQGSVFVLGWRLIPWSVDGGDDMPEAVGRVLVRAMTSLAQVTYLRSAEMKCRYLLGDGLVPTTAAGGAGGDRNPGRLRLGIRDDRRCLRRLYGGEAGRANIDSILHLMCGRVWFPISDGGAV